MKAAYYAALSAALLLASGCASSPKREGCRWNCGFAPHARVSSVEESDGCENNAHEPSALHAIFHPSDEVRAARLKLAAAVIVVAAEVAIEVAKAQR